jgi:hypothetical protein
MRTRRMVEQLPEDGCDVSAASLYRTGSGLTLNHGLQRAYTEGSGLQEGLLFWVFLCYYFNRQARHDLPSSRSRPHESRS